MTQVQLKLKSSARHRRTITEGERFGRLVVIRQNGKTPASSRLWECVCDCGVVVTVDGQNLKTGHTRSCGCLQQETRTKHGHAHTAEYKAWQHMKERCVNPNVKGFENYGGRGIAVCEEWRSSFEAFLRDVGPRPSTKHSIERVNNNDGYHKDNCKWATKAEQHLNRRCTVQIEFHGHTLATFEWASLLGMSRTTLLRRYRQGWSPEKILCTQSRGHSFNPQ